MAGILHQHVLMVIGNLKARVGENSTGAERARRTQDFGCEQNNGEILYDLCVESRLITRGAQFMQLDIQNTTGDRQTKIHVANSTMLLQTR